MNVIEKILARASGKKEVRPGDVVVANVDLMVMHDLSSNFVMKVFENEMENAKIADPSRITFVFDHNFAPATQQAAEALAAVRKFAAKHGIKNVFDSGQGSVHHVIIESGLWKPGQVIIGCDSHTPIYGALGVFATGVGNNSMAALGFPRSLGWFRVPETIQVVFHGETGAGVTPRDISQYLVGHLGEDGAVYQAIEYAGPYMQALPVVDRMLFPLMSIDVGAKCGFVNPDAKTVAFAKAHSGAQDFDMPVNDPGTRYARVLDIDVSKLGPQVACPPTVGNVRPIEEALGIPVNIAEVGGSTGGRIEDIRMLARCLEGKKVHPDVRLQVVPVSRGVYGMALRGGLFQILHNAGAIVFPPSAGSNQAFNMGAMAEDEVMVSTQARNFPGRNGHPKARHYLASTLTVAASAIAGCITDPRTLTTKATNSLTRSLVSWENFLLLPPRPEGGKRRELHDGEVVSAPPARPIHIKVQKRIEQLLETLAGERGVVTLEFPYRPLPDLQYWIADVAFIPRADWDALPPDSYPVYAPALIVEVLSPSNTLAKVDRQRVVALSAGTLKFWVVDPETRTVQISDSSTSRKYTAIDTVALAMFGNVTLRVDQLFEV